MKKIWVNPKGNIDIELMKNTWSPLATVGRQPVVQSVCLVRLPGRLGIVVLGGHLGEGNSRVDGTKASFLGLGAGRPLIVRRSERYSHSGNWVD